MSVTRTPTTPWLFPQSCTTKDPVPPLLRDNDNGYCAAPACLDARVNDFDNLVVYNDKSGEKQYVTESI